MICVFSAFILSGQQLIGEFGIGLAAAVLLDAFILRTLLVPALMHLSGRANWWLPGWLDRILPHLSIEPAAEPPAPSPVPAPARQADPQPALGDQLAKRGAGQDIRLRRGSHPNPFGPQSRGGPGP